MTSKKTSHLQSIYTCTYGIMFFGTPHHGADRAHLLGIVTKLANAAIPRKVLDSEPGLISALSTESETLQNITEHFIPMMKRFHIHFFWEQRKTNLKAVNEYIVTSESAAPTLPDTEKSAIPANHRDMVRFDGPKAPGFRTVMAALRQYTDKAPPIIQQRVIAAERSLRQEREQEASETTDALQSVVPAPMEAEPLSQFLPPIPRLGVDRFYNGLILISNDSDTNVQFRQHSSD